VLTSTAAAPATVVDTWQVIGSIAHILEIHCAVVTCYYCYFCRAGVFNIEGGCYAKTIGLKQASEPEIFKAIRFGSVLENVVVDERTRDVDYMSNRITGEIAGNLLHSSSSSTLRLCCGSDLEACWRMWS
jgi:hypothetical protein